MKKPWICAFASACLKLCASACVSAWSPPALAHPAPPPSAPVRLVVLVIVDQMRGSELDCSEHPYRHGFARLCREGRSYSRATLAHGLTETASGHATLATGASPALHGVLDKQLFHRPSATLRDVCHFADGPSLAGPGSCDARALRLATLGERLRAQHPQARVVALGAKARSANLLAGSDASLVAWSYDGDRPQLLGRTRDGLGVPSWLHQAFRQAPAAEGFVGWRAAATTSLEDAIDPTLACDCGHGPAFPHLLDSGASQKQRHDAWLASPQSDAAFVALALAARSQLHLGEGPAPDLLMVSLAATDRLGHCFGPSGPERREVLQSVDVLLGTLMAALRQAVPEGLLLAVTADHGMMPRQDLAAAARRRVGTLSTAEAWQLLHAALAPFNGGAAEQVVALRYPFVFLRPGPQRAAAAMAVRAAFAGHPAVFRAWTAEELANDARPLGRKMAESYEPQRGGDVVLALRPYFRPVKSRRICAAESPLDAVELTAIPCGARHGSPWHYDRWVPLALWGDGVEAGIYEAAVDVRQLNRTLADALQLRPAAWAQGPLP